MQHYSTLAVQPQQRFAYWREVICDAFAALDPVAHDAALIHFDSDVSMLGLDSCSLSQVRAPAHTVKRAAAQIRRDPQDCLFVNIQLVGESYIEQGNAHSVVRPGDMYVVDTARPYRLVFPAHFELLCLRLPRQMLLHPANGHLNWASARPTDQGKARIARSVLQELYEHGEQLACDVRQELTQLGYGLIGSALQGRSSALAPANVAPLCDLWRRAMRLIDDQLRWPELGVASLAEQLHVSPRYLHAAFASQSTTVAASIRQLRLERCGNELAQPYQHRSVAAMALHWGFNDIPNFNRQFRRYYGHAPTQHSKEKFASPSC